MQGDVDYKTRKSIVSKAIRAYLTLVLDSAADENWFPPDKAPAHLKDEKSFLTHCGYRPRCIHWDKTIDDPEAHQYLASIAEFVTCARKDLLFYTDSGERHDIDSSISVAVEEGVERFTTLIYNLARCRAILLGRRYITVDDVSIPLNCAMDSLPNDRRSTIELLVDTGLSLKSSNPGSFTLNELMQVLDCRDTKARDTMRLMNKIGIGKAQIGLGTGPSLFHLDDDYAWFTTDSFRKLYRPWDKCRESEHEGDRS